MSTVSRDDATLPLLLTAADTKTVTSFTTLDDVVSDAHRLSRKNVLGVEGTSLPLQGNWRAIKTLLTDPANRHKQKTLQRMRQ